MRRAFNGAFKHIVQSSKALTGTLFNNITSSNPIPTKRQERHSELFKNNIISNNPSKKNKVKRIVVVGAGISGITAALRILENTKEKKQKVELTVLEKEDRIGGKCYSYVDKRNKKLITEWGAALFSAFNYIIINNNLLKNNIPFEMILPTNSESLSLLNYIKNLSFLEKICLPFKVIKEAYKYSQHCKIYQNSTKNNRPLPNQLKKPFSQYCEKYNIEVLKLFAEPFVPGFGYGALSHIPAYQVMEYLDINTILSIMVAPSTVKQPGLMAINGGFQRLLEAMAKDLDVKTKANITQVVRNNHSIHIRYTQNNEKREIVADKLILACPPASWKEMGLDLTELEQKCVKKEHYYRYPVAVCHIKGLPPKQHYEIKGLKEAGFGNLALITTRDNRRHPKDGRLCTIYVNLLPGKNKFAFDKKTLRRLEKEILGIKGVKEVTFDKVKIWEHYNSSLPYELRLKLDKKQNNKETNTLYIFPGVKNGFETVGIMSMLARKIIDEHLFKKKQPYSLGVLQKAKAAYQFYTEPAVPPEGTEKKEKKQLSRDRKSCTII